MDLDERTDKALVTSAASAAQGEVPELAILARVTSAIARGDSPENLLRRVLQLIADVAGGTRAILGVTSVQMSSVVPRMSTGVSRTVLGQGAELACAGEEYEVLRDWEGASEAVLLDHGSRLVLPLEEGGVMVMDPATGALDSEATAQLLGILSDLAVGSIRSVAQLAEARQRAAALEQTRQRLRAKNAALREQAVQDELTGLYNRRFFQRRLDQELERFERYGPPVALVLFDIDHFKNINDTWGHPVGDQVLVKLAEIVRRTLRRVDLVARIGGEEFAVLLPSTSIAAATEVAERIRRLVADENVESTEGQIPVTISLGVAQAAKGWAGTSADLVSEADRALYRAKGSGRNQVVIYDPEKDA